MMIGHNRPQIPVADLLDHSAAQIREYNQIGSLVGNLIQRTLIELPEEERLVVYVQPLQGSADDSSSREPIGIHVRDHEKILLPCGSPQRHSGRARRACRTSERYPGRLAYLTQSCGIIL